MSPIKLFVSFLCFSALTGFHKPSWAFDLVDIERDPASFAWGFFSGYAAHEMGHLLVAGALDYESEFDGLTIVYPDADLQGQDQVRVASAGFQAQWLASEAAFYHRKTTDLSLFADNYSAGVITAHIAISAAYLSVLMHHQDGDIEGLAKGTGISRQQLALTLAIPALLDGWRLFGTDVPDWVPVISAGSKALGVAWIWSFD